MDNTQALRARRSSKPIFWAGTVLIGSGLGVGITRTGTDILAFVAICAVILTLERTLGDWMGELLGAGLASLVFTAFVLLVIWYAVGARGRSQAQYFFAAVEERGYERYFWSPAPIHVDPPGGRQLQTSASSSSPASSAPTGGAASVSRSAGGSGLGTPKAGSATKASSSAPDASSGPLGLAWLLGRPRDTERIKAAAKLQSVTVLKLSPVVATTGETVSLLAAVTADGRPVPAGTAEFSIDGRIIESAAVDSFGRAWSAYSSRVPGRFALRVKFAGGGLRQSEAVAALTVLPGK